MIKKNLKTLIITGLIILIPFIWGLITYTSLPNQIPIHFNIAGDVDGYGPKIIVLLISPIILTIQWSATIEAQIRSKNEDIKDKYISGMSWTLSAVAVALGVVMYNCAIGNLVTVQRLAPIIVGITFVVMGNLMPKQKKSRFAGLRIKWTLNNPDNWMKTHRFFGKLSVITGFIMISLSFIQNITIAYVIMFVLMLFTIFIPIVYSFALSKNTNTQ